jgi:adenosylcobinamide-GDP ribazoletransferase
MKEELRIFFTALMFYTRIPCPSWVDHSADYINKATRYFPLIGWIVGLASFVVYWLSAILFNEYIAVMFSMAAGILVTGAFHEDGFADVFDGFGGGWTKEKILDIMKDSRIGAYGVLALILLIFIKYFALAKLGSVVNSPVQLCLVFITYHSIARLTAINIVFTEQYSRADETSKAKPIAKTHSWVEVFGAYFFGLLPLLGLAYFHIEYLIIVLPMLGIYWYSKNYFNKWIGGYTGDCLGCVEQFGEAFCLLGMVAIWKYL